MTPTEAIALAKEQYQVKRAADLAQRASEDVPGDRIITAFLNLPLEPTPLDQFVIDFPVSIPTLRQYKRLDKTGLGGVVRIKKDKQTGMRMVWRDFAGKAGTVVFN